MSVWISSRELGEEVTIWESAFRTEALEEMNSPEEGRGEAGRRGKKREGDKTESVSRESLGLRLKNLGWWKIKQQS